MQEGDRMRLSDRSHNLLPLVVIVRERDRTVDGKIKYKRNKSFTVHDCSLEELYDLLYDTVKVRGE